MKSSFGHIVVVKKSLLVAFALVCAACAVAAESPKSVILFIGDGMSTPQRMTANEFSLKRGDGNLAMNRLPHQATTRTCSADSLITDSAAAATAIACGEKTRNHSVGVDAKGRRLESVAEVAHKAGKSVGIVTTVTINHATPAGFYGHRKGRGEGYGLGFDLLASGFEYFAGGGLDKHDDKGASIYKGDIYDLATAAGYSLIRRDRAAFDALQPGAGKVWFVATEGAMPDAIDAGAWQGVPTLAELTAKGLELLSADPDGFFMMVESGRIDWAGHANDAATNLREVLALDDAVKVALEFQKTHPDVLVVVTGDHETGGMTMGFADTGYAFYMDRLAHQTCSANRLGDHIAKNHPQTFDALKPFLAENFGFDFTTRDTRQNPMAITAAEESELKKAFSHDLALAKKGVKDDAAYDATKVTRLPTAVKAIFSHKCGIAWTSGAHTALPVITTAQGPGASSFAGFIDNTDISKILKGFMK